MKEKNLSGPKIPEPSDADIEATIKRVNTKYDKVIRRDDAIILTKLYAELEWWFLVDKFSREPKSISIDAAKEMREYFQKINGRDMTLDEAHDYAKSALAKKILSEKERLAKNIKDFIENC